MKLYPHQQAVRMVIVDEGHHYPTRRELMPPPRMFRGSAPMISVARSALARLTVALYGPALTPKEPEGEEVLFCPACEEPKTRFDVHVAVVSGTRSLPVVLS